MSGKRRGNNIEWDSSADEDDTCESKYKKRLRESLRNTQQPVQSENEIVVEPRKRGRGPSKRPCLNRNALMARENRLRKKAYLEKIESKLSFYQQENKNLATIIRKQGIDIKRLSSEVSYLKSVLNNNTSITALLKTINDGLRKISAQKKNSFNLNHDSECSNELDAQAKSTRNANLKGNVLNTNGADTFVANINSDPLTDRCGIENHSSDSYVSERRPFSFDSKNGHQNTDASNAITSTTSSISDDSYMDNTKGLDNLLPIAETDLHNVEEKKDIDTIGINFDQLSSFNMDIFDDFPKPDDIMNTVENLNDETNIFTEEEICQTLDNSGICLHVNSEKVSLEFCSICHLNSKNLELN